MAISMRTVAHHIIRQYFRGTKDALQVSVSHLRGIASQRRAEIGADRVGDVAENAARWLWERRQLIPTLRSHLDAEQVFHLERTPKKLRPA